MRHLYAYWISVFALIFIPQVTYSDTVGVFPFNTANGRPEIAEAVEATIVNQLSALGHTVLKEADMKASLERTAILPYATDTKPSTQTSIKSEATTEASVTQETPEATKVVTEPEQEETSTTQPTSPPSSDEPKQALTPQQIAYAAGCDYYINGSLVLLGNQTEVAMRLFLIDGDPIVSHTRTVRTDQVLRPYVQKVASQFHKTIVNKTPPAPAAQPPAPTAASAQPPAPTPPTPAPNVKPDKDGFDKHFGIAFGQIIGVSDSLHTSTFFHFNGRFEMERTLMILNAGIALGSADRIARGLHFGLNFTAAAYLTKTMIAPYVGGGFGMYVGSHLSTCNTNSPDYDDDDYYDEDYYDDGCNDRPYLGWNAFPAVGVEFLKTRDIRVHAEGRYIIAFNADENWGHGPLAMIGVAF